MATSTWSKKAWIWLSIILLLIVIGIYFLAGNGPKEYPGYVSESPAPAGTKAFYTYLDNHYEIETWDQEPGLLPEEDKHHTLLMIEPFFTPESLDMAAYRDYIEEGNTIVLFKNNPNGMFGLDVMPTIPMEEETAEITSSEDISYKGIVHAQMRLVEDDSDVVLLEDDLGVIALQRAYGEGNLIVANSPNWLTNHQITKQDHIELVTSLLDENTSGSFLIDEYIHGSGHAPTMGTLYPKWVLTLALQAGLVLGLWLWYKGKRFGPIYTPREATVRFSNEQTKALAAWMERGKRYVDALHFQADYVKMILQEKLGVPYRTSWKESGNLLANSRLHLSKQEIEELTDGLMNQLHQSSLTKKEFLAWSKKLDRLQREVEKR